VDTDIIITDHVPFTIIFSVFAMISLSSVSPASLLPVTQCHPGGFSILPNILLSLLAGLPLSAGACFSEGR